MWGKVRACAAGASLIALASAGAARPFTAKDLASLDRVSSPSISADGRYIAYALRTTDWEANKGVNGLYVGVPCKLGARGLEQIIEINLTAEERIALHKSASAVQELVDVIGI